MTQLDIKIRNEKKVVLKEQAEHTRMSKLKAKMQSDINQEATTMLRCQELSYEIELKQREIAM